VGAGAPWRRSALWGAVAAGVALLSGVVVEGGLGLERVAFAVLLGLSVALAHAALANPGSGTGAGNRSARRRRERRPR